MSILQWLRGSSEVKHPKREEREVSIELIEEREMEIPEVTARVAWIDPQKAEYLLDTMESNRHVSQSHVDKYMDDMRKGRWFVTNQGIGIDRTGRLIDGQHRLWAIIETGIPQKMLVVRGIDPQAFRALDETRKRTFADDLSIMSESDYSAKGAMVRLVAKAEIAGPRGMTINSMRSLRFTRYDLSDWLNEMRQKASIEDALRVGKTLYTSVSASHSANSALCYLASVRFSPEIAEGFIKSVGSGEGLFKGDPKYALRDRLQKMAEIMPRPSGELYLAHLIKAFNAEMRGERMYRVEFREQATKTKGQEKFPEMITRLEES